MFRRLISHLLARARILENGGRLTVFQLFSEKVDDDDDYDDDDDDKRGREKELERAREKGTLTMGKQQQSLWLNNVFVTSNYCFIM